MLDVSNYIPHQPPMRLIETIETYCGLSVTTATRIGPDSSFYDADIQGVAAWIGLEYMAQTAAVWVGLDDERQGRAIEPAFLVSSRQFTAYRPVFPAGERLLTEVRVELLDRDIVAFSGRIRGSDRQIWAEALFTAYRPKNVRDYLLLPQAAHNQSLQSFSG